MKQSRRVFARFLSLLLVFTLLLTLIPAAAESPATPTDLYPVESTDAEDPDGEGDPEKSRDLDGGEDPAEPGEDTENPDNPDEEEEKTPFLAYLKAGARLYADKNCYVKRQILGEEAVVLVVKTAEGIAEILYAYTDVQGETVPGAAYAHGADLRALTEEELADWMAAGHPDGIVKMEFPLEPVTFGTEPAQTGDGQTGTGETEAGEDETEDGETGDNETGDGDAETGENAESADGVVEVNGSADVSVLTAFIPGGEWIVGIPNPEITEDGVEILTDEEPAVTEPAATPTNLFGTAEIVAEEDKPFAAEEDKQIVPEADKQIAAGEDKQIAPAANRQVASGEDKSIAAKNDKQIDAGTDKQISPEADRQGAVAEENKQITAGADKQNAAEAARQAAPAADRQIIAEEDKQITSEADRQGVAEEDKQAALESDKQISAEEDKQNAAETDKQISAEEDKQISAEEDKQISAETENQKEEEYSLQADDGTPRSAAPVEYEPYPETEPATVWTEPEASPIVYQMSEDGTMQSGYARKYDGRDQLPDTRDQHPFGACWSFAAVGAMEIDLITDKVADKDNIDLSELFLVYYSSHNYPYVEGGGEGDNIDYTGTDAYENTGGFQEKAYRILANLIGTVAEQDAEYSHESGGNGDLEVTGYDGKIVAQIAGAYRLDSTDRDVLKQGILEHGSVEVDIWAPEKADNVDPIYLNGNMYYSVYRSQYNCLRGTYPRVNHAVLLVGWDDDYPADNFSWPGTSNGAWLVRNSWNATGSKEESFSTYFWLSYDDASMKLGNATVYDAVNNQNGKEIADYCYGYDRTASNDDTIKPGTTSATLRTSFTVLGNEKIQAVGVETGSDNQKVTVSVNVGGETVATGEATAKHRGFYRIRLNETYAVSAGTEVEVVVTYETTDGSEVVILYERPGVSGKAAQISSTAAQGGGFDLDDVPQDGDPMVKLYTQINGTSVDDPTRITLSKSTLNLKSGETVKLTATAEPSSAAGTRIVWCSSNEAIAIVEQDGTVYGAGGSSGTRDALITAIAPNGVSATCKVKVTMGKVSVTGIKIKDRPSDGTFTIDDSSVPEGFKFGSKLPMKLEAEFTPKYPNNRGVSWKSSDTSVVSVSANSDGTCSLQVNKNGTATITATADDKTNGTLSDSVTINVALTIPVTGIWINYASYPMFKGDGFQITGIIYPDDATNKTIVWTSSDEDVATVSSSGYVEAVGPGTAMITAASGENSDIYASCEVTVTAPVTGIKATVDGFGEESSCTVTADKGYRIGSTLSLASEIIPSDADNKGVTWKSSDTSVLTVTDKGDGTCRATILKNGTATVTATAKDTTYGIKSASVQITVNIHIHVSDIRIDYSQVELYEGDGFRLTGSVEPDDASDKTIIWTSSDPSVATVNSSGYVKGIRDGKAVITAAAEDNGLTASCEVTVQTSDPVKAFVIRMYRVCLLREPDQGGLDSWVQLLKSGQRTGAELVQGFYCSDEMIRRGLSNSAFLDRAYEGIMNRNPDAGGKALWLDYMEKGVSYAYIVAGFTNSPEFTNLCASYGIIRGDYSSQEPRDQNPGVTGFVSRLYTKMLCRGYDGDGLNYWCGVILANPSKPTLLNVALSGFMHSPEFLNKGLDDTAFVKVLYRTFLGREFEPNGLQYWVGVLASGVSRDEVAAGFAYSEEFSNIMAQFGFY